MSLTWWMELAILSIATTLRLVAICRDLQDLQDNQVNWLLHLVLQSLEPTSSMLSQLVMTMLLRMNGLLWINAWLTQPQPKNTITTCGLHVTRRVMAMQAPLLLQICARTQKSAELTQLDLQSKEPTKIPLLTVRLLELPRMDIWSMDHTMKMANCGVAQSTIFAMEPSLMVTMFMLAQLPSHTSLVVSDQVHNKNTRSLAPTLHAQPALQTRKELELATSTFHLLLHPLSLSLLLLDIFYS